MTQLATKIPVERIPLCVDLDGRLVNTDTLWESIAALIKERPQSLFLLPFWFLRGKAALKKQVAEVTELSVASLPYDAEVLELLKKEKENGRELILVTGASEILAKKIAAHLGLFSSVIATDGTTNLTSKNKAHALCEKFGTSRYDYIGNSAQDLPVWATARSALVAHAPWSVLKKAKAHGNVTSVITKKISGY